MTAGVAPERVMQTERVTQTDLTAGRGFAAAPLTMPYLKPMVAASGVPADSTVTVGWYGERSRASLCIRPGTARPRLDGLARGGRIGCESRHQLVAECPRRL